MGKHVNFMALMLLVLATRGICQSGTAPSFSWKQSEESGWSQDKLAKIREYVEEVGSTSAMIIQHGRVIASWGDVAHKSNIYSCRKSLLNSIIGLAVIEGKINLNDSLAKLGIDDKEPSLTQEEKRASIRDLLEARSGVYHPAVYESQGMERLKPRRGSHVPGTYWYYNNWDFNVLGYIYEKSTGEGIFDAFNRKIAQPIGMEDFSPKDCLYVTGADSRFRAYVFNMSTRDLARYALLYLQAGRWNDKQVIPESWVTASTRPYSDTSSGGYGYLWWTAASPSSVPQRITFPPGSFWAEGHLGQFAVAIPSLDLVFVNQVDGRLATRVVNQKQMSQLLQLIADAAKN